jgi:hypothetical protein
VNGDEARQDTVDHPLFRTLAEDDARISACWTELVGGVLEALDHHRSVVIPDKRQALHNAATSLDSRLRAHVAQMEQVVFPVVLSLDPQQSTSLASLDATNQALLVASAKSVSTAQTLMTASATDLAALQRFTSAVGKAHRVYSKHKRRGEDAVIDMLRRDVPHKQLEGALTRMRAGGPVGRGPRLAS